MQYNKPSLSIDAQIQLLKQRGLVIDDVSKAMHYLSHINYYRLAGYWLPFEQEHSSHVFTDGTRFEDVLDLYIFDRELRLLLLDAIERIEVSLRTQWAYYLTQDYGAHAYLEKNLSKNQNWFENNLAALEKELKRSDEVFIKHYLSKYSEPDKPATWMVCEIMSLNALSKWFKSLKPNQTRAAIAKAYKLPDPVITSFIEHLAYIRNLCAHHCRVWNRRMTKTIQLPNSRNISIINSFNREKLAERKLYNTLVLIGYLLDIISPGHHWRKRLFDLIDEHSINVHAMGFPEQWQTYGIWTIKV